MITDNEDPYRTPFGRPHDEDPRCEFCDRSVTSRFGGVPSAECDACRDEFRRLNEAGRLELTYVGDAS